MAWRAWLQVLRNGAGLPTGNFASTGTTRRRGWMSPRRQSQSIETFQVALTRWKAAMPEKTVRKRRDWNCERKTSMPLVIQPVQNMYISGDSIEMVPIGLLIMYQIAP